MFGGEPTPEDHWASTLSTEQETRVAVRGGRVVAYDGGRSVLRRAGFRALGREVCCVIPLRDAAGRHVGGAVTTAAASSTVSTRWTWASIARPRARARSSGQAGSSSVQYRRPTRTIGATEASSA